MNIKLLVFFALINIGHVYGAKIDIEATLTDINCIINNDKTAEIDFGDAVGVNQIDGKKYKQKLPIKIVCQSPPGKQLKLEFSGTPSKFDTSALKTGFDDLGIRILQKDQPVTINQRFELEDVNQPVFYAVPIKKAGSTLQSGRFSTQATLIIHPE